MKFKREESEVYSIDAMEESSQMSSPLGPPDLTSSERLQVHIRLRPFLKEEPKIPSIDFWSSESKQITSILL